MREPDEPTTSERILLSSGRYITFGPFRVDQQRQEVTRNGARLKLQGKVYQVLITLLEKPAKSLTREELRMRLWPADTHVNYDANVNTTVNKLRQALGDSSDKPLYVETIPRKAIPSGPAGGLRQAPPFSLYRDRASCRFRGRIYSKLGPPVVFKIGFMDCARRNRLDSCRDASRGRDHSALD